MKKLNPLLLTIIILISLNSCSNKWHIVRNENKLHNLKNWKQDSEDKKAAKKDAKLKDNVAKY